MSNPWDDFDNPENKKPVADENSVSGFSFDKKTKRTSQNNQQDNDSEDFFEKFFNGIFGKLENLQSNNGKSEKNNGKNGKNSNKNSSFKVFLISLFGVLALWFVSGLYTVRQEENAIIMRFGKYVRDVDSGLHYHIPYPIEEVVKEATTRVRVLKIGGEDNNNAKLGEGWALTGDENIVNLELNVQWKIDDLKKFVFSVRDKEQTIYDATQSAIREVISRRKLADILTSGRGEIEEETKKLLPEMLNSYNMGVNILVVQMLKIDPPAQVIDSFRDVQTARVDKESEINKAYKYKNDILPKVKGEAGKIIEDANGYAISVVNRAKGDANRFNQVYEQYKNSPYITRKRMYLDAMEDLFGKNKITIVDENVKNVFLDNKNKTTNEEKSIEQVEENSEQ